MASQLASRKVFDLRRVAATPRARVAAAALAVMTLIAARVGIVLYFTPLENKMYSESLVRFRYAEMVMEGRPLPRLDYMVQWPEGFRRAEMMLPLPDHITGWSYRLSAALFGKTDHYQFLRYFMALYSALYVPAALLLFYVLFRRFRLACLGVAFYITSLPTFLKAAGTYLREDFASPALLVVTALAAFIPRAAGRGRLVATAGLAAATFYALSCWHMAQFYLNLVLGVCLLWALLRPARSFGALGTGVLAGTIGAGLANEALFVKGVLWSPTVGVAGALAVWGLAMAWRTVFGRRWLLLALAGIAVCVTLFLARGGAYNHAYALVFYKIRYLGVRPDDPSRLPLDARVFWMGPYDTASPRRIAIDYHLLLPFVAGVFLWAAVSPRGKKVFTFFPAVMTTATAVLYGLIVRLTIFFAPWVAALATLPVAVARARWSKVVSVVVALVMLSFQVYWILNYGRPTTLGRMTNLLPEPLPPVWDYGSFGGDVFRWLRENTAPDAAVLAQFGVSAGVMYWAQRPTVLHPMFEVPEIRPKTVLVSKAYMGSEEDFYRLCRRWRVSYVLFNAPIFLAFEPPGDRYYAAVKDPPAYAVGRKMQFAPGTLRHFRLVFETPTMRLFEVGKSYDGYVARAYHPYFDTSRFPDLPTWEHLTKVSEDIRRARDHYATGIVAEGLKRYGAAAAHYALALKLHPDYEDAELRLGYCLVQLGRVAEAEPHFRRGLYTYPDAALAHTYMGSYYFTVGQYSAALAEYRRAAELAPGDIEAQKRLELVEKILAGG